jgi:uncharacterized phage protein (TIGR02218 family)
MKTISNELKAEILNGTIANCLKITLNSGIVHGFTDHNKTLVVDGVTYLPAPGLQKIKMNNSLGTSVSNQEFGSAWVDVPESDLIAGKFDNAEVDLYWVSWKNPSYGKFPAYSGKLGALTWSESGFQADIVSSLKDLERLIGPIVTANCRHDLYGTSKKGCVGYCGVNKANFTFHGTISSVIKNKYSYGVTGLSNAAGFFSSGTMLMTSGPAAGATLYIKTHASGELTLSIPSPYSLEIGDTFDIYAGCDLTLATCRGKFGNLANFGGFPHIKAQVNFK